MSYISNSILISLLKQYGVRHLVLSPGTRNIPFVSCVEVDPDFTCYSVVDERNAAFFALGLSQEMGNVPVVLACTSGTAVSNYLTGITEAYYSNAPIIIVTPDRSPYVLNQLETQKIDQMAVFTNVVKKAVQCPLIKDDEDVWYCQRVINEALIALTQHGAGPVQINIPFTGDTNNLNTRSEAIIKKPRKIDYYVNTDFAQWMSPADRLKQAKRILVVMGQTLPLSDAQKESIRRFAKAFKAPVLGDNLTNFRCDEFVMSEAVIKGLNGKTFTPLLPDIVITFGHNFQERIKDILKAHAGEFEHWLVDVEGKVKDVFRSQSALFESTPFEFFDYMAKHADNSAREDTYLKLWKKYEAAATLPELAWTSFYTIQEFAKAIPNHSLLHLAILNSIRLAQFFPLDESVRVYANVNTFGIDGCFPTFVGQAAATDDLAFLVIGDLSFFYGMNAASIKHVKNNVRILVLNNGGAAEFHIQPDSHARETVDLHIGCSHDLSVKSWVESVGYRYISADSKEALKTALAEFTAPASDRPVVLEIFTDMHEEGPHTIAVYRHLEQKIAEVEK